jgi:hypothetical protein
MKKNIPQCWICKKHLILKAMKTQLTEHYIICPNENCPLRWPPENAVMNYVRSLNNGKL